MVRTITKSDLTFLLLRFSAAGIFIIEGYIKLFVTRPDVLAEYFTSLGFPLPLIVALLVGALEFFGGILLLAGLFTRVLGMLFAIEMLVATIVANLPQGFSAPLEVTILLLFIALALGIMGSGKISIDHILFHPKDDHPLDDKNQ